MKHPSIPMDMSMPGPSSAPNQISTHPGAYGSADDEPGASGMVSDPFLSSSDPDAPNGEPGAAINEVDAPVNDNGAIVAAGDFPMFSCDNISYAEIKEAGEQFMARLEEMARQDNQGRGRGLSTISLEDLDEILREGLPGGDNPDPEYILPDPDPVCILPDPDPEYILPDPSLPEDGPSSESDTSGEISQASDEPVNLCLKYEDISSDDFEDLADAPEPPTAEPLADEPSAAEPPTVNPPAVKPATKTLITQVCVKCHQPMDTTEVGEELEHLAGEEPPLKRARHEIILHVARTLGAMTAAHKECVTSEQGQGHRITLFAVSELGAFNAPIVTEFRENSD